MPFRVRTIAILGLLLAGSLSGCGAQQLIQGEPNFNTAVLLPKAVADTSSAPKTDTPPEQPSNSARNIKQLGLKPERLPAQCEDPVPTERVEECVYLIKAIIDDQYREYRITLHHFANDGNAAADITVLGLTGAATGPVGIVAKTVLSGLSTFIGGAKQVINQDLLFKQTIEIIINQMDADRQKRLTVMLKQMGGTTPGSTVTKEIHTSKTSTGDDATGASSETRTESSIAKNTVKTYTWAAAKTDLLAYFSAGTWDHALTSLQVTAAKNHANCQTEADIAKVNLATKGNAKSGSGTGEGGSASECPATSDKSPDPKPADSGPWSISFATDSSALDTTAQAAIKKAADVINTARANDAALTVTVRGYTDVGGSPARNKQLVGERADKVRDELIGNKVPANIVVAMPGETSTKERKAVITMHPTK